MHVNGRSEVTGLEMEGLGGADHEEEEEEVVAVGEREKKVSVAKEKWWLWWLSVKQKGAGRY